MLDFLKEGSLSQLLSGEQKVSQIPLNAFSIFVLLTMMSGCLPQRAPLVTR